jgi:hypothetical protein
VIHSLERVVEMVKEDPDFARRIQKVESALRGAAAS